MYIPISRPYFTEIDREAILRPLESGWVVQGPNVESFEKEFLRFIEGDFAIATSSCTTALHLCLVALGIGREDKVVLPSFTYIASANAIEYVGAIPVFCDIDLKTFNIDTNKLVEIIEKERNIKAVMPVNLFGLCANMVEIMNIAKKYDLKVIEDSACGFDAWILNKHSGTFGDCGCFSFHPRKSITTGEGGMIITNSEDIAQMVKILRDHGASKSDLQRHNDKNCSLLPEFSVLGYNYRLTDIQGALGNAQMKQSKDIIAKRRKIVDFYNQELAHISSLIIPYVPDNYRHGYQSYVCLFGGEEAIRLNTINEIDAMSVKRNLFMQNLEAKKISTRQGTHAVHTLGYYKNKYRLEYGSYLQSYKADRLSISLPVYPQMTELELEYVVKTIKELI